MKEYLIKYRPFLQFLGVFLISYLLIIVFYQLYLGQFDPAKYEVDGFTDLVARQTKFILTLFNYTVELYPSINDPSVIVEVDGARIVRVIEGCNAISVMILFAAFILAFSNGFVKTFSYIVFGLVTIHVLNVLRIALLTIGFMKYPEYKHIMHGVIFPLVIYGIVFLLWIFWVTKFVNNDSKNAKV